jgi:RimJ/RimL family protein N-acetyltransferase
VIAVGTLESEPSVGTQSRVRLLPMALEHVDALTEAATTSRTTFDLAPVPRDRAEMVRYVERALVEQETNRSVPFVVEHVGSLVGSYRLMSLEWWSWPEGPINVEGEPRVVEKDPPDVAEIGHAWLTPAAQRTEVNSSVCHLLMRHAFEAWRVHRLVLKTDARNTRSRNAITRLGGKPEGIMRSHSPAADGVVRDTALFSILPAEWPEVRMRLESALSATHNR